VAQEYGVFNEQFGFSDRAVFVVDKNGLIAFKRVYPAAQLPDIDEIVAVVQRIAHEKSAEGVAGK
jgi:alkyl hydroperoxide reductase subunit AhpC